MSKIAITCLLLLAGFAASSSAAVRAGGGRLPGILVGETVGNYHAGLIQCAIVPADQAAALKQQALAELTARGYNTSGFDRDYEIGFQRGIFTYTGKSPSQKIEFCARLATQYPRR
jgi:hypothetical protein